MAEIIMGLGTRTIKILMISPQFRPLIGGYERAAERLSIALTQKGHQVTIIAERQKREWPKRETLQKVSIYRWWCVYKPGWHIITSIFGLAIFLLVKGRKFDVWHIHQYGMHAALVAAFGKALHRPVVLKLTSSSYMGIESSISKNHCPKIGKWLHLQYDAVVALTHETAKEANLFGFPKERIHVLGNGVDIQEFRPRSVKEKKTLKGKLGLKDCNTIVNVGRLSTEKNLLMLLNAMKTAISNLDNDWQLVIVGFGPNEKYLKDEANNLELHNVTSFVGQQTNIAEWFAASDIFIQSSNFEGLSNTLLEALSSGLPVIVTNVSGTRDLVFNSGSGFVVPIGDISAMAEAIINMCNNVSLRQKVCSLARKVIENGYSIEYVTKTYENLYLSLLKI